MGREMRFRVLATALAATLAFSITGIGTPAQAATSIVRMKGTRNKFRPVHTYIAKGDKVSWRNMSRRVHDVTAYGGGWTFSKVLSPGQRTARRFRKRRTYRYRCVRHSAIVNNRCSGMCGFVHVVA
ncbi:MAG TPA: hypothetical protein VF097_11220 [Actinomycetota bacterium]